MLLELNVGGVDVGLAKTRSDIYQENWWDPDYSEDPTETPPKLGELVMLRREERGRGEYVAVHSDGTMSYERRENDDTSKIYRNLTLELQHTFEELVKALPRDRDQPGPDGNFKDPAYLSIETPTDRTDIMIDAVRVTPEFRAIAALMDGWRSILLRDSDAVPKGLEALGQESSQEARRRESIAEATPKH